MRFRVILEMFGKSARCVGFGLFVVKIHHMVGELNDPKGEHTSISRLDKRSTSRKKGRCGSCSSQRCGAWITADVVGPKYCYGLQHGPARQFRGAAATVSREIRST